MLSVISSLSYDTTLLSHFLRYYNSLGVRAFIISVHELVPGILTKAQSIAQYCNCNVNWVPVSARQASTGVEANNKEEIRALYSSPDDWIIPADLDEFIQFPVSLSQLIMEMNVNDATFIKGEFSDRVSKSGHLIKVSPQKSIWDQFPYECAVSQKLVKCWCHKVTLCRGDCMLSSGHHNVITNSRPLLSRKCVIHHFKWRKDLLNGLRERVKTYKRANWPSHRESERVLSYFNGKKGIDLSAFDARIGWNPAVDGLPRSCVIYTSITAGYDNLKDLPKTFKGDAQAVAFVEQPTSSQTWQNLPACAEFSDPCRNAKKPKILPHLYFPEAEYSLWIDGSIDVLPVLSIAQLIDEFLNDADMALFSHRCRRCAYDEAAMCIRDKKDDEEIIRRQMISYQYQNFPKKRGLGECCIILRRHTDKIKLFNEVWWEEVNKHSRRDQLSFDFVCWKLCLKYNRFPGTIIRNPCFRVQRHNRSSDLCKFVLRTSRDGVRQRNFCPRGNRSSNGASRQAHDVSLTDWLHPRSRNRRSRKVGFA